MISACGLWSTMELVAGLYALRAPKKPEKPGVLHALQVGNPVAAYDVGLVAIIGENTAREIEPFVVMLGAPCRNLSGPVRCELDKNGIAGFALQLVNSLLLYLGQLLQLLFLLSHVPDQRGIVGAVPLQLYHSQLQFTHPDSQLAAPEKFVHPENKKGCKRMFATQPTFRSFAEREALEPIHSRNIIKLQITDNHTQFGIHSKSKSF